MAGRKGRPFVVIDVVLEDTAPLVRKRAWKDEDGQNVYSVTLELPGAMVTLQSRNSATLARFVQWDEKDVNWFGKEGS